MPLPLLFALQAEPAAPRHELGVSALHCFCLISESRMDAEFGFVSVPGLGVDYAYRLGAGFRVGATAAVDLLADSLRSDSGRESAVFGRFGATIAGRWGGRVRGGIRLAAGGMYGDDGRTKQAATGWFFDSAAELAWGPPDSIEFFLSIAIVNLRQLQYPGTGYYGGYRWSYTALPFPPTLGLGARFLF